MTAFHSGFVSLVGRPNVGKSTLMNRLVGEKVAIISPKPQTTRNQIRGIYTGEACQMVFIDTPGLHRPRTKLGNYMVRSAEAALNEVDVILLLVEPSLPVHPEDREIIGRLAKVRTPVFLVINKLDTIARAEALALIDQYRQLFGFAEIIPVSALRGDNVKELLAAVEDRLPEGPRYFPADMITDQPERQLTAELIREKALGLLQEEIPHGIAVEIISMNPREESGGTRDLLDVEANIYCEKESHKGIIIGKNGDMLKKIGSRARSEMENLLGSPVYLQLWVKVKKDWRDSEFLLRDFGYR